MITQLLGCSPSSEKLEAKIKENVNQIGLIRNFENEEQFLEFLKDATFTLSVSKGNDKYEHSGTGFFYGFDDNIYLLSAHHTIGGSLIADVDVVERVSLCKEDRRRTLEIVLNEVIPKGQISGAILQDLELAYSYLEQAQLECDEFFQRKSFYIQYKGKKFLIDDYEQVPNCDLALLFSSELVDSIKNSEFNYTWFTSQSDLDKPIVVYGFPKGREVFSQGSINGVSERKGLLELNLVGVDKGTSGSAVAQDMSSGVVGVIVRKDSINHKRAYAEPIVRVDKFLEQF